MFKNLVYSVITKAIIAFINFFILILSSRYLGVNSRGEISIFILNIAIIQILNEVYTGYSIVHFIPKFDLKKMAVTGVLFTLVFCGISNALIVFFNKQVQGYEWLGYFTSVLVILNTFNCVLILGKENIKMYNLLSFLQPFLLLVGISFFIFVLKKYTFEAYVYPLLFSFICASLLSGTITLRYVSRLAGASFFDLKPIIMKGLAYQAAILMFMFANRYSYYLLPDSGSVGLYSSACTLMESVLLITNAIAPLVLSRVANSENSIENITLTLSLAKISFLLSVVAVVIINLLPETLFIQVLGNGFTGINILMREYSPVVLMISLFSIISSHLSASGKQNLVVLCYGAGFLSSLVLAPLLIHLYGVSGAALNANITYFIMTLAIGIAFVVLNKISLKKIVSLNGNFEIFKKK